MTEMFDRDTALLLDRLEPPALSADFADRIVARAEAVPPLPKLRPAQPSRRRWALAIGVASLFGVAAAAAVVPARVWRELPVIGTLLELIAPARPAPSAPAAERKHAAIPPPLDAQPGPVPEAQPVAAEPPALRPVPIAPERPADAAAQPPPARFDPVRPSQVPFPAERARDIMPEPVRERATVEPQRGATLAEPVRSTSEPAQSPGEAAPATREPAPAPTRTLAPERLAPTETRQIVREAPAPVREVTAPRREAPVRERIQPVPNSAPVERIPRAPLSPARN